MRALFKHILKGNGTPVLQTLGADGETILSAGNIWTSAHTRRIELSDRGLDPGDVVCSEVGGFQSVVDFVACAIGGFVYVPAAPEAFAALQQQVATRPLVSRTGILLIDSEQQCAFHPSRLPAALHCVHHAPNARLALIAPGPSNPLTTVNTFTSGFIEDRLARLSACLGTPVGGSRLSYSTNHHDCGFVVDLLLGIINRQAIYLRSGESTRAADMVSEVLGLAADDLVMPPAMLEAFARECQTLPSATRTALASVRVHTGGKKLTGEQHELVASVFDKLFVERLETADAEPVKINRSLRRCPPDLTLSPIGGALPYPLSAPDHKILPFSQCG